MLERLIYPILAPFRYLRSTIWGIKQAPAQLKGEISRARGQAGAIRGDFREYGQDVKSLQGKAQQVQGMGGGRSSSQVPQAGAQVPGVMPMPARQKMGLFSKKKKCPACGQKLHASWEECPYCGWGRGGAQMAPAPTPGIKQRTMAMDASAAMAPGPVSEQFIGWFIPLEGKQTGELLPIKGRTTVGTAPDCGIIVQESSISGHHAEFVPTPNGFRLNDLGSTNGTYVNDKRVSTHDLVDNDNVRLGRVNFKYKSLV